MQKNLNRRKEQSRKGTLKKERRLSKTVSAGNRKSTPSGNNRSKRAVLSKKKNPTENKRAPRDNGNGQGVRLRRSPTTHPPHSRRVAPGELPPPPPPPPPTKLRNNKSRRAKAVLMALVGGCVLGVGVIFAGSHLAGAKQSEKKPMELGENATQQALKATKNQTNGKSAKESPQKAKKRGSSEKFAKAAKTLFAPPPEPDPNDLEALARASNIPPEDRVFLYQEGKVEVVNTETAEKRGFSVINLSDHFTPYLFSERTPGKLDFKPNNYQRIYKGVADDRIDEEGRRLGKDQHNFVELFGIPPTLSVLQKRFVLDESKECYEKLNLKLLRRYGGIIRYKGSSGASSYLKRYEELRKQVLAAKKKHGNLSLDKLARKDKYAFLVKQYRIAQVKVAVIHQAQMRLRCESLLDKDEKYRRRHMDYVTHKALARFERKHMIFGWGQLHGKTLRYLGSDPTTNNHRALMRVLRERVVHSLGILEDGTASKHEHGFYEVDGKRHKVPNLVKKYTSILAKEIGLDSSKKASEFFHNYPPEFFAFFYVGVKLPKRPPYYSDNMSLSVELDRGDVWYDYPYDGVGKKKSQPRSRLPHITLFTHWKNQKIALIRWHTTIGGWRREFKDGKLYLAYKGSPPGLKTWRNIVAAPVWIPPATTPPAALLDRKGGRENGRYKVKRKEIGPSYRSAYGLVAAYHIEQIPDKPGAWVDEGIRTHGSVSYMSIFRGFSHGCHRLHNHLAVRLFSYILRHYPYVRKGQIPLAYEKRFNYRRQKYKVELNTRGYKYSLKKPVNVTVTEGRIRGELKKPIEHYMPYPGIKYSEDDPNLKPGCDKEEGWAPAETIPSDVPPDDDKPINPASSDLKEEVEESKKDNQTAKETEKGSKQTTPNKARKKTEEKSKKPKARPEIKTETETKKEKTKETKKESKKTGNKET